MRRTLLLLILPAAVFTLLALAFRTSATPDLGLIVRYVEELDGQPLFAGVFDIAAKKTFEYGPGDYVKGMLVRQVLRDRVVLVDEITKYQYVLVVNELDFDEPGEPDVTRLRAKRRDMDDMDVTAEFNREMARADGSQALLSQNAAAQADAERAAPLGGRTEAEGGGPTIRDSRRSGSDTPNPFRDEGEKADEPAIPSAVEPYKPQGAKPAPPAPATRPSSPVAAPQAAPDPAPEPPK